LAFETDLVNQTRGIGVMSHLFHEYGPDPRRHCSAEKWFAGQHGSGRSHGLRAEHGAGARAADGRTWDMIYVGQIVGENAVKIDIPVNPCKAKTTDQHALSGDGKGISWTPAEDVSRTRLEYIGFR
jgi:GTP-binding protein